MTPVTPRTIMNRATNNPGTRMVPELIGLCRQRANVDLRLHANFCLSRVCDQAMLFSLFQNPVGARRIASVFDRQYRTKNDLGNHQALPFNLLERSTRGRFEVDKIKL